MTAARPAMKRTRRPATVAVLSVVSVISACTGAGALDQRGINEDDAWSDQDQTSTRNHRVTIYGSISASVSQIDR